MTSVSQEREAVSMTLHSTEPATPSPQCSEGKIGRGYRPPPPPALPPPPPPSSSSSSSSSSSLPPHLDMRELQCERPTVCSLEILDDVRERGLLVREAMDNALGGEDNIQLVSKAV